MNWTERKRPGPPKKKYPRVTIHATVDPAVADFIEKYRNSGAKESFGRVLDKMIAGRFAVKLKGDQQ